VQPFERLRYLARWSDEDDRGLVSEAADCLAGFADDPAGLVVACRRLVSHHPVSGALWWLCARVLTAPDPADAAWEAWQLVNEDGTADRLSRLLPFPHDEPIAVLGWPDRAGAALAERPDLDVIAIRRRAGDDHRRARLARREASVRIVSELRDRPRRRRRPARHAFGHRHGRMARRRRRPRAPGAVVHGAAGRART
jgi:hypothetical protein